MELALRAITYLAPSIPREFFEFVVGQIAQALGREIELVIENRISGPMHGDRDPFAEGAADLGFLCSPSYLYLRAQQRPSIELVPAGFVFDDPRRDTAEPVYYSDIVVRDDHPARSFAELVDSVWGYNDECSLSGYFATLQKLAELNGDGRAFFRRRVRTGSHLESLAALRSGAVDVASIDSVVLAWSRRQRPELTAQLRVVESCGPFPIQPVVLRRGADEDLATRVAAALQNLGQTPASRAQCNRFGLRGCVAIGDELYREECRALQALGHLPA